MAALLTLAGSTGLAAATDDARGGVTVFLAGTGTATRAAPQPVVAIEAIPDEGEPLPLGVRLAVLDPSELAGEQRPLAAGDLAPGLYRGLLLRLRTARPADPEPGSEPEPETLDRRLATDFRIWPGETATLIVDWDLDRAVGGDGTFNPGSLTLRPAGETVRSLVLYALDGETGELYAINRATDEVFASIRVGSRPGNVAFGPLGRQVYVSNSGDDTVSVIDPAVQRVIDTYPLRAGSRPAALAVTSDGGRLVVACPGRQTVAVVETRSNAFVGEIALQQEPGRLALSRDDRRVFVLLPDGNRLVAADIDRPREPERIVELEGRPSDIAVDGRSGAVYVTHAATPVVSVFSDTLDPRDSFEVGFQAEGILIDPDGARLFLSGGEAGGIAIVNARVGVMTQLVPTPPAFRLATDPGGRRIYASSGRRGRVLVIDKVAGRVIGEISLGGRVVDLASAP